VEAFVEDEIVAPVAFASGPGTATSGGSPGREAPAITFVTNPDDGTATA
jgi:H+/Cl- antiporter ClcA